MATVSSLPITDVALVAVLVMCAATDVWCARIFNIVTYPAIALGLAAAAAGMGPGFGSSIAGCVGGGMALYVLFACGAMGGGDVKLMAAVGAFKGYPFILNALFCSVLAGGVAAAILLTLRGHFRAAARDLASVTHAIGCPGSAPAAIHPRGGSLPFGVAIGVGTLAAMSIR